MNASEGLDTFYTGLGNYITGSSQPAIHACCLYNISYKLLYKFGNLAAPPYPEPCAGGGGGVVSSHFQTYNHVLFYIINRFCMLLHFTVISRHLLYDR